MEYIRQYVNSQFFKLLCWKQKKWANVRIQFTLTRVKLWWCRASLKQQVLWGLFGIQWLIPRKGGLIQENRWTGKRVMSAQGPLMHVTLFPNGSGLLKQDNVPCYTFTILHTFLHFRTFSDMVWGTWQRISQFRGPIDHLWDVLNKHVWSMKAPPCNF